MRARIEDWWRRAPRGLASIGREADLGVETRLVQRFYDRLAPSYDRYILFTEMVFVRGGRRWVCSRARGAVLEVAVGTGRNLRYYPGNVFLTGVDLSPVMLAQARARADSLGLAVDLRVGDAQSLPFPDQSFDSIVFTLCLCIIPDERRALREAYRVLRPGGRLLLLEPALSPHLPVAVLQRLADPFLWPFHERLTREPLRHAKVLGFVPDELRRGGWGMIQRLRAHRPLDDGE